MRRARDSAETPAPSGMAAVRQPTISCLSAGPGEPKDTCRSAVTLNRDGLAAEAELQALGTSSARKGPRRSLKSLVYKPPLLPSRHKDVHWMQARC